MSRSKQLYRLQQLDSTITRAQIRIKEIEAILGQDEVLQKAMRSEEAAKGVLEGKQKSLRKAENDVEDQELKLKQIKAKLYGGNVTNHKELEDLQQKSESLQRYLEVLEVRQLEAMMEVDEAEESHEKTARALSEIRADREGQHAELMSEKAALETQIKELSEKRPGQLLNILPEDLQLYEELRKSRAGVAVAAIENQSCTACGTRIPSAIYQVARSPSQIAQCSTCKRILYEKGLGN
ncbi:MAG: hypothetical protein U9O54_06785 [Chloroflexota bacterium]|nr:hypothetical protein [Chloroflexota bacterium]